MIYEQDNDTLPLLNETEELVSNTGINLIRMVSAETSNSDMDTIYESLQKTLDNYNDEEEQLYRIDLSKTKDYLTKDIKYGHKQNEKDFYVYSTKTGNVYYYDYLKNGNDTIHHSVYDTKLHNTNLMGKTKSLPLDSEKPIQNNDLINMGLHTVFLGGGSTFKISEDGLYAWGGNKAAQLGIGGKSNQTTPKKVLLPEGVKPIYVASKNDHSLAICDDGNVYAWGINYDGQLGNGNSNMQTIPQKVIVLEGINHKYISPGKSFTSVLTEEGEVYGWGHNYGGQLGNGTNKQEESKPVKALLPEGVKIKFISTGQQHTLALDNEGNIYSWGRNVEGQLGIGTNESANIPQKIKLPNNIKATSIYATYDHSLAIGEDGNLYAWGYNGYGQLGIGNKENQLIPVKVNFPEETKIKSIAGGFTHSVVIDANNNVYTWGGNNYGQLGVGNTTNQLTPVKVELPNGVIPKYIYSGYNHIILMAQDDSMYGWGENGSGQLGIGNTTNQLSPIKIEY